MDPQMIMDRVMLLIPLVLSLTVHEFAHAWSAWRLGDDTAAMQGRLTLNPVPHIDPIGTLLLPLLGVPFGWAKPVPVNPARLRVLYGLGMIYDEYREANNASFVGLNWSSLYDINARTFEMMAMKQVPVINRLPHLDSLGLFEDRHYLGFDTVEEGVEQVEWALAHPSEASAIALSAHNHVHKNHTYDLRIQQIFDEVGL
jgi:hypothetical protein